MGKPDDIPQDIWDAAVATCDEWLRGNHRSLEHAISAAIVADRLRGDKADGLTPRQLMAYNFIVSHVNAHGFAPSYGEIADALGVSSKSGISRIVSALRERGLIWNRGRRWRSISLRNPAIRSHNATEQERA